MRPAIVTLVFVIACRPSTEEARAMLASSDQGKRDRGAAELQKRYAEDPKSVGDHGDAYWAERIKRAVGRPSSEGLAALGSPQCRGGEAGGGGETRTCKLDDFWSVDIGVSTRGDQTLFHVSSPRRHVERFEVEPPPALTGTWTTYFAHGGVFQSFELERGMRRRTREHNENGTLRKEAVFVDGKLDGTLVSRDANGVPEWEDTYAKGEQVGVSKLFYPSGKLRQETPYTDGKIDGVLRNYAESGAVTSCSRYRAGTLVDDACDPP